MRERNIFEIAPDEIRNVQVVLTVVGRRTVVDRSTARGTC
jgi:predicted amidohydrolase YtcJ